MKLTGFRRWKDEREKDERQFALAVLSPDSPGFDDVCNRIAVQFDNIDESWRATMYDKFRRIRSLRH